MPNVAQDMKTLEKVTKEIYLPFFNNMLNVQADPFLAKIPKAPMEGAGVFASRIGVAGNVGMSEERAPTPISKAPLYNRMSFTPKDAYVELAISQKAVQLGRNSRGNMIDGIADYMEASYEGAKWNTARMVYGDGTGKLANITAAATATNKIKVDTVANVIVGLTIDVHTFADGAPTLTTANEKVQVIAIDAANKELTLSNNVTASTANSGAYGFITVQQSYGREITGLGAFFNSSVDTVYGLKKSENKILVPQFHDAKHAIDDVIITKAVRASRDMYGAEIDTLLFSDDAYTAYEYYMKTSNVSVVEKREFVGGARGYSIVVGNREIDVVNAKHVPAGKIWGADSKLFEFRETGWDFADYQGSAFVLKPGSSEYRGLLSNYMELVCKNPGALFEISNANDND
jgi:hypothetical protein